MGRLTSHPLFNKAPGAGHNFQLATKVIINLTHGGHEFKQISHLPYRIPGRPWESSPQDYFSWAWKPVTTGRWSEATPQLGMASTWEASALNSRAIPRLRRM